MGVVGILGTMHGEDSFREQIGYTLENMRQVIADFKPDIICGEVRPEDWEKYCKDKSYSGYLGPNEYRRMIIPYCEEQGVEFVPVDWFEDDMVSFDYLRSYSEEEKDSLMKEHNKIYEKIWDVGKKSSLPLNSFEFNELIMYKQEWLGSLDPTIHNMYWTARNQLMVERIKAVIKNNQNKRILCTVGAEHNYFYFRELNKEDLELVFPI